MNEILRLKKAVNSNSERGMRWFTVWNTKSRIKQTAILCECNKLVGVRPAANGAVNFSHRCGFAANIILEDFAV